MQTKRSWRLGLTLAVLGLLLLAAQALYAQVDTGAITGTVKDASGAVIPGAKVTLTNEGTAFSVSTVSDSAGGYTFTPIKIGSYKVTAEFQGFQTSVHPGVMVSVQQRVVVDFALQPGQVTQTVEVMAAVPLLQTQNGSVGQVVGAAEVNDLPLNGRNYTFLAQLSAGVTKPQQDSRGEEASGTFAANGLRPAQNNYILDGIDNNNNEVDFLNGTGYAVRPPVDAVQEFKVQTSNFSAELGRAGGAVLNATIKSGTNHLHGDAWEFLRNSGLDAANFFENAANQPKGEFRQNQFGATLGGPVVIPHLYNGRQKTFFFVDYEGTRLRQASVFTSTVPTAAERASGYTNFQELITGESGTRTDLLGQTFPLGTIFDPATTRAVSTGQVDPVTGRVSTGNGFVRDPFPANTLPASRLDSNAIKLLDLYPAPNGPGIFNNYTSGPVIQNTIDQFDVRVDHNFSEKDQMFGRVSYADEPLFTPGPFSGIADGGSFSDANFTTVSVSVALSETHSFSSNLVNEARLGYSRLRTTQLQPFANTLGIPEQFGIQGIPQFPQNGGLPSIVMAGLSTLGSNGFLPGLRVSDTTQVSENLTYIHGAHTLKGGFEFQSIRVPWYAPAWSRGYFDFGGVYTEVPSTSGGNTGVAQMLLTPTSATVPGGLNNVGGSDEVIASNFAGPDEHRHYYATYLEDDWKVNSKLTVNLGIRWEYSGQLVEKYGAEANFIPGPAGAGAQYLITNQRKNAPLSPSFVTTLAKDGIQLGYSSVPGLTNTPLHDFSPRLGLVYQFTPRLVFRGGYGIFYDGFEPIGAEGATNYPFNFNFQFFNPDPGHPIVYSNGSLATLNNGFTGIPLNPIFVNAEGLSLGGIQTGFSTPYVQEYNAMLQYQLTPSQTIQIGYLGTGTRHLQSAPGSNQVSQILPPNLNPQLYVPFPDISRGSGYVTTEGNSIYNSLQATFERRFSGGLNLLANYTYAKCRTDARDNLNGNIGGYRAPALPGFGIQGDYALCDVDIRNTVHLSGVYQLPFGAGKRFLNGSKGLVNQMVGGWQTNWILTLEDGQPFTVPCNISTTAAFGCNALLVPGQNVIGGPHNVNHWMNPAAFTNAPVAATISSNDYAVLGGAPTQLVGPGFHRFDFSLFKQFRTSEATRLEFRCEFFNLTNTPQFSLPGFSGNGVVAAPGALDFSNLSNFGKITSTRDGAFDQREIQFALKFYW